MREAVGAAVFHTPGRRRGRARWRKGQCTRTASWPIRRQKMEGHFAGFISHVLGKTQMKATPLRLLPSRHLTLQPRCGDVEECFSPCCAACGVSPATISPYSATRSESSPTTDFTHGKVDAHRAHASSIERANEKT